MMPNSMRLRVKPHIWKSPTLPNCWVCFGLTRSSKVKGFGPTPQLAYLNFIVERRRSNRKPQR